MNNRRDIEARAFVKAFARGLLKVADNLHAENIAVEHGINNWENEAENYEMRLLIPLSLGFTVAVHDEYKKLISKHTKKQ